MPIRNPYTREFSSYSPQRSAVLGRSAVLPQEYSLGYPGRAAAVKQPQTVDEMIYAAPPTEMASPLEGGPGVGAFGGEGGPTGIEGTTDPAQQAINANILGLNPTGFLMGKGNPFGVLAGMAIRGGNEILGDPLGKAKDFISGKLGLGQSAQGMFGEAGKSAENAVQAAFDASVPQSIDLDVDMPDVSDIALPTSLADIGIGGTPSSGNIGSGLAFGTGEFGGYEGAMGGFGGALGGGGVPGGGGYGGLGIGEGH